MAVFLKNTKPLVRDFFDRDTVEVSKELLGKLLVRKIDGEVLVGKIVETEAYLGRKDPAAHSFIAEPKKTPSVGSRDELDSDMSSSFRGSPNRKIGEDVIGETKRNKAMFGEAGRAYIYQMRGYHCLNAVTESAGKGTAILIRAAEPLAGLSFMQRKREKNKKEITKWDLMSGPGKICQAMSIDMGLYGTDLTSPDSPLQIHDSGTGEFDIEATKRIGITKAADWKLRFIVKKSEFVSR